MILLLAIIAGLLAGVLRAWYRRAPLTEPGLRRIELVAAAFVPQGFVFFLPATRGWAPDDLAPFILVASQALLLLFAWLNRGKPGFWMLMLGLACNLIVIVLNGGLMPISPETVTQLRPDAPPDAWQVGHRLGNGKDVVLAAAATQLWWLSDRFVLPVWFPYRAAFSAGDVFIAAGAFWFLWALGGGSAPQTRLKEV